LTNKVIFVILMAVPVFAIVDVLLQGGQAKEHLLLTSTQFG
jgi:hypothetical protein